MDHKPLEYAYGLIANHLSSLTNPVIFELGMCDGYHTQMLLSMCKSAPRYIGFEPDPRNVIKIRGQGLDRRITFCPDAVGHVTNIIPFNLATPEPNGAVGASSISEFTPTLTRLWPWLWRQGTVDVLCWRLDDYCAKHSIDHIDFIWMDVQGAERLVFEGAKHMLPHVGMVWTEYDGGTLYKDSSTIDGILNYFPDWEVLADCGGDVLLKNSRDLNAAVACTPAVPPASLDVQAPS
jgi:FkbM family methyltransferase